MKIDVPLPFGFALMKAIAPERSQRELQEVGGADFGFALLMATARRVTESEHYLRAGKWTEWRYDLFAGAEVHGSTLGIIGMGRIGQGIAKRGAYGFGMKVVYHNRSRLTAELEAECKAAYVSKQALLQTAFRLLWYNR